MNRTERDKVIELVNQKISDSGFRCIEADWSGQALVLFIDGENIDLDACVFVSRSLEEDADIDQLVDGPFELQVSSPGLERPLRSLADFTGVIGSKVEVKLQQKHDGRKHGIGTLNAIDDELVTLSTNRGDWKFPHSLLDRASLVYDWN